MRTLFVLFFFLSAVFPARSYADSSLTYFGEMGGTFSLKSPSRVLDDRGGVFRAGAVYSPYFVMGGLTLRGAHVFVPGGGNYPLGNIGLFAGLSLFQNTPFRLRVFLPYSWGRIKAGEGTSWPSDNNVWFFEPEVQASWKFTQCCAVGLGVNHRYVYSYDGKPGHNEYIEKLMFTGSFIYEFR